MADQARTRLSLLRVWRRSPKSLCIPSHAVILGPSRKRSRPISNRFFTLARPGAVSFYSMKPTCFSSSAAWKTSVAMRWYRCSCECLSIMTGFLVLTSNRVGTFDEAFKSRIQLALHYKNLSEHQRTKIWGNFLRRLKELDEEGIDFLDLEDNIEQLAKHNLNGRQIRNVITTARQYARWERQHPGNRNYKLDYGVINEVIGTAGEFVRYIEKLNGGYTHDQLAEDDGLRLQDVT